MTETKRRVLIVDDEAEVSDVLEEALAAEHSIEVAANGPDALAAVARIRPDLVLLDMNMPGMTGLDVLHTLRIRDSAMPVILITATGDNAAVAAGLKAGAFAYIPKPFNLKYVRHLVAAALADGPKRR